MRSVLGWVRARATSVVMGWEPETRRDAPVLALILAVFFVHYGVWCLITPFFIEDAGISFAYARNIAMGLGAVPFAGAERVEGYSNASWTFLLAALYVFKIDPFFAAKVLGGLFGSITLLVAWAIGHEARGEDPKDPSPFPRWAPLIGPTLLACSTQFTLWSASGLENSLFNLLLSVGIWRLSVEIRTGSRAPWSALAFMLLTMTRPDGIGYAAVGLLARVLGTLRNRQWAALPLWLLAFAVPYAAYNAVRYEYFAWWFPNTYYAKDKSNTVKLLGWTNGGWKQLKDWALFYGVVFATPAVVLALLPISPKDTDRWRRPLIGTLLGLFAVATLWDGRLPSWLSTRLPVKATSWYVGHITRDWNAGIVLFLVGAAVLLGLLTLPKKGWAARGLLWGSFSVGAFFWVWSNGDWMKAFRWGSLVAVPVFTLIGLGIGVLVESLPAFLGRWLPRRWGGWLVIGILLGIVGFGLEMRYRPEWVKAPTLADLRAMEIPAALTTIWKALQKEFRPQFLVPIPIAAVLGIFVGLAVQELPNLPAQLRRTRVSHVVAVLLTLALASPNTWKSWEFANGPETTVNDVHRRANYMLTVQEKLDLDDVTLIDVDMGAHMYFTPWHIADMAGLIDVAMSRHKHQKSFTDDYVYTEVRPSFAHVHGSWARTTKIPQNSKWKEQYLEIPGYPSGRRSLHVGNHIRKEYVARKDYRGPPDTQVDFEGGVTMAGWEIPSPEVAPGGKLYLHTWWIATARKVGFRVIVFLKDDKGHLHSAEVAPAFDWYRPEKWKADEYVEGSWYIPLPPKLPEGDYDVGVVLINNKDGKVLPWLGASTGEASFLPGEWVKSRAVHIVPGGVALKHAEETLASALGKARSGDCEGARVEFKNARRHVARNLGWRDRHAPKVDQAVVACFVTRADGLSNPYGKSEAIRAALRVDPTDGAALAAGEEVGQVLYAEGMAARAANNPQGAYNAFLAALRADPTLSWARVYLEQARDLRLGISGKEPEKAKPSEKKDKKDPKDPKKPSPGNPNGKVPPAAEPEETIDEGLEGEGPPAEGDAENEPQAGGE